MPPSFPSTPASRENSNRPLLQGQPGSDIKAFCDVMTSLPQVPVQYNTPLGAELECKEVGSTTIKEEEETAYAGLFWANWQPLSQPLKNQFAHLALMLLFARTRTVRALPRVTHAMVQGLQFHPLPISLPLKLDQTNPAPPLPVLFYLLLRTICWKHERCQYRLTEQG